MLRCLKILTLIVFASALAWSQDRGTITGTVTDSSGASIAGAKVLVKNLATGLSQETVSGGDGRYTVPYLPIGNYSVAVEKEGFGRVEQTGVRVEVATVETIDVKLQVGTVQQNVEVTGNAPLLQTETSDLGKVMNTKEIIDLPLALGGGLRDNLAFAILTPGTTYDATGANSGGNSLRIGGGLSGGTSLLLDGNETQSERRNDVGFNALSTDAIGEFRLISNSFSAEYGRLANGVMSYVSKSGTNELHGTAFEYFRNTDLNARQFFSATRNIVKENNFGGTIGGPVVLPKLYDGRNKAFFFFSYEKALEKSGSPSSLSSVPSNAMRNGDFSNFTDSDGNLVKIYDPNTTQVVNGEIQRQQFPGNVIPMNRISNVASTVLKYVPEATLPGNFNNIPTVGNGGANQRVWSIKGDYNINDKSRLSGLITNTIFSSPDQTGPIPGPLGNNFNSSGTLKYYRLAHDQTITPTLLNHASFGWNHRQYLEYFPSRYNDIPESDRAIIGVIKGATTVNPTSNILPPPVYSIGGGYPNLGEWINTDSPGRTVTITDQLSWVKGSHSLKFGFEFLRADFRRINCNNCTGEADFSANTTGIPGSSLTTGAGFASFLLGLPASGSYNDPGDFSFGEPYYAFYLQDDWKVNRKLTVNLGLRYELPFSKSETQYRVSNVCLTCPNPAAGGIPGALQFAGYGPGRADRNSFLGTRHDAWGPRIGFAYEAQPGLVIRAGGGIYYVAEREGGNSDNALQGFQGISSITSPNSGYTPAFTLDGGLPPANTVPDLNPGQALFQSPPFAATYAGYAPRMYNWNFTIEKSLGTNTVMRASYQGQAGVGLLASRELLNQVDPKYLSLGSLLNSPIGTAGPQLGIAKPWASFPDDQSIAQALRPFPQYQEFQHTVDADTTGHMTYHAVNIGVEHRYSSGLWLSAYYTFSKLITNTEGENPGLGGFVGNGDVGTQNGYDRSADKSISNQDIPHHVVLAYTYELPFGKGRHFLSNAHGFTQAALGGWKISAIQNYQSGYPLRVTSNQNIDIFSGQERANIISGVPLMNPAWNGDPAHAPYINPAAFERPAPFTFGNSPRNLPWLRTPWQLNEDVTLGKQFPLFSEGRYIEFKASAFNIANRVRFGPPDLGVESATFGIVNSQANNPREIQLNLRLVF
jgi:hypothetical protein